MKYKKISVFIGLIYCSFFSVKAQSTWDKVYTLLQTHCSNTGCHAGANPAGLLYFDLAEHFVYDQIWNQFPQNETAATINNNRLIYAGDPYRSYIFRKINNGFAIDAPLTELEQDDFHENNLTEVEKELIRQWILFGAPDSGKVVEQSILTDFYNGNGVRSIVEVPEPPENGFQIHIGPFFLPPGAEQEYFYKYPLDNLDKKIEVIAFDTKMGNSSHHFIMMKFWNSFIYKTPFGLRKWNRHDHATFEEVAQESQRIELPKGSAFEWGKNTVLDLNTHYLNYSASSVLACEIFVNIETQPTGTANQVMSTLLIPDTTISIPNNGERVELMDTFIAPIPINDIYIWSLTSHAHQYSVDYDIFQPLPGEPLNHVYDASCPNGIPGCDNPFYDYERPPTRYFNPFLKTDPANGVIHQVTYTNNSADTLIWDWTVNGEMMVFVMRFLLDTVGVEMLIDPEVSINNISTSSNKYAIYPNPSDGILNLDFDKTMHAYSLSIYNTSGKLVFLQEAYHLQKMMDFTHFNKGIYVIVLKDEDKQAIHSKKIVLQ